MKFEFMRDGKPLDAQGWGMEYDGNADTAYAPIYGDGQAVAMVMIKGDETIGRLVSIGQMLVTRANSHDQLVSTVRALLAEVGDKGRPNVRADAIKLLRKVQP